MDGNTPQQQGPPGPANGPGPGGGARAVGTRSTRRADLRARLQRRDLRRAVWLAHDRENRSVPRPARNAASAWTAGFLFFGLILLLYGQGGPVDPAMSRRDQELGAIGMGLMVAAFAAGAIAIWHWRGRHPPSSMIYRREILATGQGVSHWDARGNWVAKDYGLWAALIFLSLPVGLAMLPYYTIAGLASPLVAMRRLQRQYRERKAV